MVDAGRHLVRTPGYVAARHVARGDAGDAQRPLAEFRASPGGFLLEK